MPSSTHKLLKDKVRRHEIDPERMLAWCDVGKVRLHDANAVADDLVPVWRVVLAGGNGGNWRDDPRSTAVEGDTEGLWGGQRIERRIEVCTDSILRCIASLAVERVKVVLDGWLRKYQGLSNECEIGDQLTSQANVPHYQSESLEQDRVLL